MPSPKNRSPATPDVDPPCDLGEDVAVGVDGIPDTDADAVNDPIDNSTESAWSPRSTWPC